MGSQEALTEQTLRSRSDFLELEELGEGSFSTVYLVSEKSTSKKFALKQCYKAQILREKKVHQIFREKEILSFLSTKEHAHPFIVQLYCTFQDQGCLYFVMTLALKRDLLGKLKKLKHLSVKQTIFVASEVTSALEHIHKFKIVHRDVKPENILITETGHTLLSDFGCAKRLEEKPNDIVEEKPKEKGRRGSFVGTSYYVSPEILNGDEVTISCDLWCLGVVIYQLLTGLKPFYDVSEYLTFQRILKCLYDFPSDFPSNDARDLIEKLLVLDPNGRLGAHGAEELKSHPFFTDVRWEALPTIESPLL
uniref:non-specific serine/threonine protein kinase n=1 Tax=Acrobeloides nanus TaxID=290746 RepID=A0A914EAZ0_9BILA